MHFSGHDLQHLLAHYGYWAVMLFVTIESIGIPFPGETMLVAAAIYAGTTHQLNITLVVAAASCGAIFGDNVGFWAGREFGYSVLLRIHKKIGLNESKLKLGQYLFRRHGGKVVFFGRFVAILRTFAAVLAGINQMEWGHFLVCNCAGGIIWASAYGFGGYYFGKEVSHVAGPIGIVIVVAVVIAAAIGLWILRRNEARLEAEAEKALPGPLQLHLKRRR